MNINKLKTLLFLLIIAFIGLSGIYYKISCDKNAQRFYSQGEKLFVEKKYSDAYYNFKQIKPISDLYELSLLKQYQCANNLDDKKTAVLKLKEIVKTTKNEDIKPWALYNEAILSKELKLDTQELSAKKFKYIQDNFSKSDFAVASAYKAAHLSKDLTPSVAKENYLRYLSYAPTGKFSLNAIDELTKLDVAFSKEDYEIIANSMLENGQYRNAVEYFQKTYFSKNWYKISKCYRNLKDKELEKETILKGLKLSISDVGEKEISVAIDRLINLTNSNKVQLLQEYYTNYQNSYIFPTVVFKLAQNSSTLRALKLYELISNDYPASIWASNALWEVFWYNYQEGRYGNAQKLAKKHVGLYSKMQDSPRVAYWYGRTLLKLRKNQQAKEVFYNVIAQYPLSYYSFLSAKQLKASKANKMIVKKAIVQYDKANLNKTLFKDKTLLELANKGDWELIDSFKLNNELIKSWIAYQKGNYPLAINIAKKEIVENKKEEDEEIEEEIEIDFSNQALKLIYPIFYEKEINHYAQSQKQSPYLFLSLIREESHFDKNAKSSAGAMGLSQLMPSTANFIENKQLSKETLLDADENIRIGLKYFSYLVNYFKGNEYLAILAYNAGNGNINKWLNDSSIKSHEIEVFVENIPYLETKNYIKKILSSYWVYLNIYSAKHK
ncbi:MAG: lytic transglycosylase domain-containing protein [Cyanobacteria bacterium SIG27]|nr:lytic transglycosylase domain-containing protein [Cyanobacteria bacterium SIG27]